MTTFTRHARERAYERTGMHLREIKQLIDLNRACPLGQEGVKNHWLFFSMVDDDWFVAVRDEDTKEIITVYPYQYRPARCKYHISTKTLNEAKNLAIYGKIEPLTKAESDAIAMESFKQGVIAQQKEKARLHKLQPRYTIWAGREKLYTLFTSNFAGMLEDPYFINNDLPPILGAIKAKRIVDRLTIAYSTTVENERTPLPALAKLIADNGGYAWMTKPHA